MLIYLFRPRPSLQDCLDTKDPEFLAYKLCVLAAGVLLYGLLTAAAYGNAVRSFEKLDL